jgi:1-acyl-sn-glycerol-3-phosphate acyltransferase
MNHPTIWGHNCSWYHHIFNFFILNTLSLLSRILLLVLDWRVYYNRMYFCTKHKNIIRPTHSFENIMKKHKNLVCVSSHTSIWDSILIMLYIFREKVPTLGAAKYELFWGPFGYILRYIGFIPIYWDRKTDTTSQIVEFIELNNTKNNRNLFLGIFPEGSRWKEDRWKTGFWRIAQKLNCKILTIGLDYEKRYIVPYSIIMPTDDVKNDIEVVKEQLYPFIPLYPENTDVETRYDDKRNLCVTVSGNVMDIPRKTGDDHEIVLSPYNSEIIQNIFTTFIIIIIFYLMSLMPNDQYTEHALIYDLF